MELDRFIQIHALTSYTGVLLNRDDSGLAKRLPLGGVLRTRVSSQCLKRHWRTDDGPFSLKAMGETAVRSRHVDRELAQILRAKLPDLDDEKLAAALKVGVMALYGKDNFEVKKRQALLLGHSEIAYLGEILAKLCAAYGTAKEIEKAGLDFLKENRGNLSAMRDSVAMPGGIENALFGRMVTADTKANMDAAIHVAHAFTVHGEESEADVLTVVDDLRSRATGDDAGSGGLFDTEINSGLFYIYVVVDVPQLVSNTSGVDQKDWAKEGVDRTVAADAVERLVNLIARVSPGAKRGSTAPYGYAEYMLVERGDDQPRSLASAFHQPVTLVGNTSTLMKAAERVASRVSSFDEAYGASAKRAFLSVDPEVTGVGARIGAMKDLASFAAAAVRGA